MYSIRTDSCTPVTIVILEIVPELLDWSSDNVLVAALGQMYHKWSWRTQNLIEHSMTKYPIACCKFHPRGKLLALGTTFRSTEIHDNVLSKCITCSYCECQIFRMGQSTCAITAVEWSPTGTSYAMGCSAGMIRSFTNNSDAMFRRKITTSAILFIRISPDSRYVAVTSVDKDVIHILNWPSFDIYSVLETAAWTVKAINWHPWRSALLGVGIITDDIYAHVVLWEVPSGKVTEYGLSHNHYYLDALLFSHRTGELVVSLHDLKVPNPSSQLVVMSDQDTAVDQWGGGRAFPERVRHMIFSPDGSKLASATSGEDLIIWNFLPEDKNKMKTSKFASIPLYMDIVSLGYSVR